jgi:hypothetical protein
MPEFGTTRTCRGGLTMSVHRGRPEVVGPLVKMTRLTPFGPEQANRPTFRDWSKITIRSYKSTGAGLFRPLVA